MSRVLIAGGSGLLGKTISKELIAKNYDVIHLSRSPKSNASVPTYKWDINQSYIDPLALEDVDFVINLAGTGIADKRWTAARKKSIIDSRVNGNLFFKKLIEEEKLRPKKFISSGAIGFYGDRGNEKLTEQSAAGDSGFLAESCKQWEDSVMAIEATNVPVANVRIGIVLSKEGGALEKMLGPAKFGLGSYFGDGSQIYSWVHIKDIANIFIWLVENNKAVGTYNGTAPNPISNKKFAEVMMQVKAGPGIVAPVPKFVLNIMLGEMKDVVLTGSNVLPERLLNEGFKFEFEQLEESLKDLI